MPDVFFEGDLVDMAEVLHACKTSGKVVVWQPPGHTSIVSRFVDLRGTVVVRQGQSPTVARYFARRGHGVRVRLHADGELVDVATEEDDLWARAYNCLQHPPCAQCERCLMFKDVLSNTRWKACSTSSTARKGARMRSTVATFKPTDSNSIVARNDAISSSDK